MKYNFSKFGLVLAVLAAGTFRSLALDGAVVIANSSVAVDSLTGSALKDIYTGKTKYWDNGQAIIITVLPDKTDAALQQACGMDTSAFKTFWQRLAFSGRGQEPKRGNDTAAVVAMVAATKGAIAIVPEDAVLTDVKKLETK